MGVIWDYFTFIYGYSFIFYCLIININLGMIENSILACQNQNKIAIDSAEASKKVFNVIGECQDIWFSEQKYPGVCGIWNEKILTKLIHHVESFFFFVNYETLGLFNKNQVIL